MGMGVVPAPSKYGIQPVEGATKEGFLEGALLWV